MNRMPAAARHWFGKDVADARNRAYEAVRKISFEGCRYREDIAANP